MKYFSISIFVALLVGCGANIKTQNHGVRESTKSPIIEFVAKTDMKKWDEYAQDVRWGIAASTSNITTVIKDGWSYNEPVYDISEYGQYILKSGVKSFEKVSIPVNPGVHDWLILLDLDNNGTWDSYLGSAEEHIKLDKIEFQNGFIYSVVVGEDSIPKLEIKPNKLSQQDAASGAAA
ncbi:hypothetical protein [Paraglaciecola sp.]|uniref:hypothetical protein n=1 Tax=Paraglaciecola sp. TaxID=1920173 RepID=UPI003EFB37E8